MSKRVRLGLRWVPGTVTILALFLATGTVRAAEKWPSRDHVMKGLKPDVGLTVRYSRSEITVRMDMEQVEEALPELEKALKNICPEWDGLRQALSVVAAKWKGTWSPYLPYNQFYIRTQMSHPSFIVMFKYRKM